MAQSLRLNTIVFPKSMGLERKSASSRVQEVGHEKLIALLFLASMTQWSYEFLGGAAAGAAATGVGYEYSAKRQMDRLEDDYKNERISRKEYESRKKQIEAGSIIY